MQDYIISTGDATRCCGSARWRGHLLVLERVALVSRIRAGTRGACGITAIFTRCTGCIWPGLRRTTKNALRRIRTRYIIIRSHASVGTCADGTAGFCRIFWGLRRPNMPDFAGNAGCRNFLASVGSTWGIGWPLLIRSLPFNLQSSVRNPDGGSHASVGTCAAGRRGRCDDDDTWDFGQFLGNASLPPSLPPALSLSLGPPSLRHPTSLPPSHARTRMPPLSSVVLAPRR